MSKSRGDRRLRSFLLSPEILESFALPGKRVVKIHSEIPKTAKFFSSFYDHERRSYVAIFEDESFIPVPFGSHIPIGPSPTVETISVEDL